MWTCAGKRALRWRELLRLEEGGYGHYEEGFYYPGARFLKRRPGCHSPGPTAEYWKGGAGRSVSVHSLHLPSWWRGASCTAGFIVYFFYGGDSGRVWLAVELIILFLKMS